jgi:hypothetical protein
MARYNSMPLRRNPQLAVKRVEGPSTARYQLSICIGTLLITTTQTILLDIHSMFFGSNQDFNMLCLPKGMSLPVTGLSKVQI